MVILDPSESNTPVTTGELVSLLPIAPFAAYEYFVERPLASTLSIILPSLFNVTVLANRPP
jgi:hypothetical protein